MEYNYKRGNKMNHTDLLKEGTLNDDLIHYPPHGKVFKGNYIAIIERYTFANEWCNRKELIRFRSKKQLYKYLNKHYPNY